MFQLSVFMPSNRKLTLSARAIESALDFCVRRNAILLLADNSADPDKQKRWSKPHAHMRYLPTDGLDAKQNFLAAMRAAETPFVLPMGDDDELLIDAAFPAFDLANIPPDHMGIVPKIEVWSTTRGILRAKSIGILGSDPAQRMQEYNKAAKGDNGAFYSIFRREPYQKLMELFFGKHPVAGSFSDWAMVMALFSWGRLNHDPGIVFRYNFDQWQTAGLSESRKASLYEQSGLTADARKFHYLFLALDIFCFSAADFSPLSPHDTANAFDMAAGPFLSAFLKAVATAPEQFDPVIHQLCYRMQSQTYMLDRFRTALEMIDTVKPGLKAGYLAFLNSAMGDA